MRRTTANSGEAIGAEHRPCGAKKRPLCSAQSLFPLSSSPLKLQSLPTHPEHTVDLQHFHRQLPRTIQLFNTSRFFFCSSFCVSPRSSYARTRRRRSRAVSPRTEPFLSSNGIPRQRYLISIMSSSPEYRAGKRPSKSKISATRLPGLFPLLAVKKPGLKPAGSVGMFGRMPWDSLERNHSSYIFLLFRCAWCYSGPAPGRSLVVGVCRGEIFRTEDGPRFQAGA